MKQILITLFLILGLCTSVIADDDFPTAHEILGEGKILHKEVHYQKDSPYYSDEFDYYFGNQIVAIQLIVQHKKDFFDCWIDHLDSETAHWPVLKDVKCKRLKSLPTVPVF